jgi:phage shock protein C
MMDTSNRLTRSTSDVMLGGVCAGLGRYFKIDATLVRLIFVLLTLAGGSGVLVYIVLWIIIPRDDAAAAASATLDGPELSRRASQMGQEMGQIASRPNQRTLTFIGIALVVMGLVSLLPHLNIPGLGWFSTNLLWPALIVVVGVILLVQALRK